MYTIHHLLDWVALGFEVLGVAALAGGFVVVCFLALKAWYSTRSGRAAYETLREGFGGMILLSLEILIAADLISTVTSRPTMSEMAVLGVIVLIRTVLSFSLQTEMDGVAPWRRALVTGPEVIAKVATRNIESAD